MYKLSRFVPASGAEVITFRACQCQSGSGCKNTA